MAERKPFLLRIDSAVLDAVQRWANDDLRSLNAQIEFVLRDALRRVGRLSREDETTKAAPLDSTRAALSHRRKAKEHQDREEPEM